MQSISTAATNTFDQSVSINAAPRVTVEWNQNRFATSVTASTTDPAEGAVAVEEKKFPIESIILPNRPTTGMPKARIGEGRATGAASTIRYRTASPKATYKYFSSKNQSGTSLVSGGYTIFGQTAQVDYAPSVRANKIVVKFETSWTWPVTWNIEVNQGGTWTAVGINPVIDAKGTATLYLQSNGTWTSSVTNANTISIDGVRTKVASISKPNAHLSIIEISARYEVDITRDVITCDVNKEMEDPDILSPIGTASANSCSVNLDNTNGTYDLTNPGSPYYGLLDDNARVKIDLGVEATPYSGIYEWIPQGSFFTGPWSIDSDNATVTIEGHDHAIVLQNTKITPMMLRDAAAPEILRELLSRSGFNNFNIPDDPSEPVIPFVWWDEDETVWSAIQDIVRSSHGAFFFDENGVAQYLSKMALYGQASADWKLLGETDSSTPTTKANIISLSHKYDTLVNKVDVVYAPKLESYKKTTVRTAQGANGMTDAYVKIVPSNAVLWQPDGTVALNAAMLHVNLTATATSMTIDPSQVTTWPFEGKLSIEGEVIAYKGKVYRWFKNRAVQLSTVYNHDEQLAYDALSDPATRYQNAFSGTLTNLKRGQDGTVATAHVHDIAGWGASMFKGSTMYSTTEASKRVTQVLDSSMMISGPDLRVNNVPSFDVYTESARGALTNNYHVMGTRMRFQANATNRHASAGIFFNRQNDGRSGYYIELTSTKSAATFLSGAYRELRAYRMGTTGVRVSLPNNSEGTMGVSKIVVEGATWVDIDVVRNGNTYEIYADGQLAFNFTDYTYDTGMWGCYTRGNSSALFEYFYCNNKTTGTPPIDITDSTFYDRIRGGFVSGYSAREIYRRPDKAIEWFYDDFGPWCHEIRTIDLKFDKAPTIRPYLMMTNEWDAYLLEESYTPFGGQVVIANSGRDVAILNGEDTNVFTGNELQQQLLVFGQVVFAEEENTYTAKNDASIRRRGEVTLSVESKWIQTLTQATNFADFVTTRWGDPADNISVETFINPALQIGDMVTIYWPTRSMTPTTHKYIVNSISIGFEAGIKGTVGLRRLR